MEEYVFQVAIAAEVCVRAPTEFSARDVVVSSSTLTSPSTEDIRLANAANFMMGKQATITHINFVVEENSVKLINTNRESTYEK
jgi:hypothetical protein